jgi:SAM-dependent methyltransferase
MSDGSFKDHFSNHAAGYAAHRPTYPDALVDYLAEVSPGTSLALDCGCGTGQLSVPLARRFSHIVATDASESQIANAERHPHIEYRTAPAEASGLDAGSADLVTVAQAAHWLDLPRFYDEARRVIRAGGVVALITYGLPVIDHAASQSTLERFYFDVVGGYWPPERRHVEAGYRTLEFPFPELTAPPLAIAVTWRLRDLVGYVDTWSAVRAAEKKLGRAPIEAFERDIRESWGDPDMARGVSWPLSLRIGRVTTPLLPGP